MACRTRAWCIPPGAPWGSYPGGSYSLDIEQMRAALARACCWVMLAFTLMTGGALLLLALLITAFVVHGGVLGVVVGVLLAILAAGVVAVAGLGLAGPAAVAAARLDRGGAAGDWPAVASWVARMARWLLTGRALWRLRTKLASRA